MVGKLLLTVLTAAIALVIYLYFHLGFYKPVEISVNNRGPLHLLSKTHTGPYFKINPVITAVEQWAHAQGLSCDQTFGEYLDDPQTVDEDRLRSRGGCVLARKPTEIPEDFSYEERPERKYVVAHFAGSPSIGPMKVYPKVKDYIHENRLKSTQPVIEIYRIHGSEVDTEILFPID